MTSTDSANPGSMGTPDPLAEDYQRFLQLGSRRAPHTLYVHERGYRSGTINTDALGMRYSHCAGKRFSAGGDVGSMVQADDQAQFLLDLANALDAQKWRITWAGSPSTKG